MTGSAIAGLMLVGLVVYIIGAVITIALVYFTAMAIHAGWIAGG